MKVYFLVHGATDLKNSWRVFGVGFVWRSRRKALGFKLPFTTKKAPPYELIYERLS